MSGQGPPLKSAANSGKAKKPRGRPFQPGMSGNPNGRPKGVALAARAVQTLAAAYAQEAVEVLATIMRGARDITERRLAATALLERGAGRVLHVSEIEAADARAQPININLHLSPPPEILKAHAGHGGIGDPQNCDVCLGVTPN